MGKYLVTFENPAFEAQKRENIVIPALSHDYKFDSFVWGDDFTAKAKYVCAHDASHIKLENATVTDEVTTQPGCETEGVRTYIASYEGHSDTKTEAIPATGHDVEYVQESAASCEKDGNVSHYHCNNCGKNWSDKGLENELADVVVPATGHNWGAATYEWNEDHTKCTAKHVCLTDESHVETEEVDAVEGELESTDCWLYGLVASFTKKGFEPQIYDYYRFTLNGDEVSYTVYKGNHLPSNVVIPSEINKLPVTRIGKEGFHATGISSIFIPNTITVIDDDAISYCGSLSSIVFEEGSSLQSIGVCGIFNNGSLSSLTLPASLTGIAWWGLAENYHLNKINYLGTMDQWRAIGKGEDWNEGTPGCGAIHCTDGDVDDHYVDDWDDFDDDFDDDDW